MARHHPRVPAREDLRRFSIRSIVRRHYEGMRVPHTGHIYWGTRTIIFGLPLAVGLIPWLDTLPDQWLPFHPATVIFPEALIGPMLTLAAFLGSALFATFTLIFNLRLKVEDEERWKRNRRLSRLLSHSAASALYLVLLCIGVLSTLILVSAMTAGASDGLGMRAGTSLLFALGAHGASTFFTITRRVFGAYEAMFRTDFIELDPTSDRRTAA